jgi:nitroimidazol reductase NimA-like FMN-containing flavoprotein (pyridoxamine 5'-phosphate oxidase superfamily)
MVVDDGLEVLSEDECRLLLERAHIGRVAVTLHALPAIFPVNYIVQDGHIVFMTGEGTKLRAASRNAVVAFEIDGYDPLSRSGWSVLVVGMTDELDGDDLAAAEQLPLEPWAGGSRNHYVRLTTEFVSGRRLQRFPPQPV